ncbi:MAG: ATP-grasp domain-containing protein [bacterium]
MNTKCDMPRFRVGVLMGGKSIEREVSFNSGRTICDHLDTTKYEVIPIFQTAMGKLYMLPWHFLHRGKITDFFDRLEHEAICISWDQFKKYVDFVYIAVHGRYGEDGTLQGMLEVLNIPYLGAKVFGSAAGMNKAFQKQLFAGNGIRVPAGIVVYAYEVGVLTEQQIVQRLKKENVSFPCIVKPVQEGSSLGVQVVHDSAQLLVAIKNAHAIDGSVTQDVIVEEKIEGMEFVCVSLQKFHGKDGGCAWFSFPLTEVVIEDKTAFFDYEQKYMPGRALKITPPRCNAEHAQKIAQVCEKAAKILDFSTISRIDGILTKDGDVVIIDPNSLTGMSPATFLFHQAAEFGMNHTQLINFLIESELARYGIKHFYKDYETQAKDKLVQKKIRIGVLLGGDTNEREISLESGRNVCYKLSPEKYDVVPLFVRDDMKLFTLTTKLLIKNSTKSIAGLVDDSMHIEWSQLPILYDFIFNALHGGKGENGAVQGALEMLAMPYNGSGVLASALCMDKFKTSTFLRQKGFDVPGSILIHKQDWHAKSEQDRQQYLEQQMEEYGLHFPCIVKPADDGCSMFVGKVKNWSDVHTAFAQIFDAGKESVMLEELIKGMELTCGVIGNNDSIVFPPSQAVATQEILSIEEKFLPGAGTNITPAPLSKDQLLFVQNVVGDVYKVLGCKGYTRIDCFYQNEQESPTGKQQVVILENNSLPALTPATCLFHQAAEVGIRPMELIDKIVELGFQNHQQRLQSFEPIKKSKKKSHKPCA